MHDTDTAQSGAPTATAYRRRHDQITALNIYPVKSCRGIALERARITATGFEHDREWLIVHRDGRFITQREEPRLALIETALTPDRRCNCALRGATRCSSLTTRSRPRSRSTSGSDRCAAFDAGDDAAAWLQAFLGKRCGWCVSIHAASVRAIQRGRTAWRRSTTSPMRFLGC